jgi:hypothetical protein
VSFSEEASDGSGGLIQAAAVRVQFAAATPAPPPDPGGDHQPQAAHLEGGFWLELPPGAGTVVFSVQASNAQRVRLVLTPTGTGSGPDGKLLGEDRDPRDRFTLVWRYPSEGLSGHLGI